jgi:hypothetical protein
MSLPTPLWFWEVDLAADCVRRHFLLAEWVREIQREAVLEILFRKQE